MAGIKLAVVLLAKNEADIIPAWLASVARWADMGVLIDHGSTDGTLELLRAGARKHGWEMWREFDPVYRQEKFTGEAIERCFARGADWVLPLDADELLQVANGDDLRHRLAAVPPFAAGSLQWVNCIPAEREGMWWVTPWRCGTQKVAIPRWCWGHRSSVVLGNHAVQNRRGEAMLSSYVADLMHFPLRSLAQMRRKLSQGAAALVARDDDGGEYQQWTWGAARLDAADACFMRSWAMRYPAEPLPGYESVGDADFARWGWTCLLGPGCKETLHTEAMVAA